MTEKNFPYVGIDLETTGFDSDSDEIIEISAIEFNLDGDIGEKYHKLCWPKKGFIPAGASKVNNIYIDDVKGCPNYFEDKIREEVAEFIGDRTVMGHNFIGFDYKFLKIEIPKERQEDTLLMCRKKYASGNKLKMACKRIGISWNDSEAHRSEYDTMKCIELFCKMKSDDSQKVVTESINMFDNIPGISDQELKKIGIVPTEDDKKMMTTQAYSFSRINLFHQCAFKWYMRYIKKHPEPDVDFLITGKICHTVAEMSAEWCAREIFANKMSSYFSAKGIGISDKAIESLSKKYSIDIKDVKPYHMGIYLHDNPEKISAFFPNQKGRGTMTKEMDSVIDSESYERPSMPDWETYESIIESAINSHKCMDPEIITDVNYIMSRFYENTDFSTYIVRDKDKKRQCFYNIAWPPDHSSMPVATKGVEY